MEELQDPFKGFQKIGKAVKQSLTVVKNAMLGNRDIIPTKWPRLNNNLLGGFRTGELVGRKLKLALEHIKKQIEILEN